MTGVQIATLVFVVAMVFALVLFLTRSPWMSWLRKNRGGSCEHKRCRVIQERNVTHCYDCGSEWKPSLAELMQEDIMRRDEGSFPPDTNEEQKK